MYRFQILFTDLTDNKSALHFIVGDAEESDDDDYVPSFDWKKVSRWR